MQRLAPRPGAAPWLLAAGTALLLCGPHAARAQSLDTDGLEQLFGEPITTSATGKPQRASEVAANMEIITADDIRRSGADNSTLTISPVREVSRDPERRLVGNKNRGVVEIEDGTERPCGTLCVSAPPQHLNRSLNGSGFSRATGARSWGPMSGCSRPGPGAPARRHCDPSPL